MSIIKVYAGNYKDVDQMQKMRAKFWCDVYVASMGRMSVDVADEAVTFFDERFGKEEEEAFFNDGFEGKNTNKPPCFGVFSTQNCTCQYREECEKEGGFPEEEKVLPLQVRKCPHCGVVMGESDCLFVEPPNKLRCKACLNLMGPKEEEKKDGVKFEDQFTKTICPVCSMLNCEKHGVWPKNCPNCEKPFDGKLFERPSGKIQCRGCFDHNEIGGSFKTTSGDVIGLR